jgi:hypothetical protein
MAEAAEMAKLREAEVSNLLDRDAIRDIIARYNDAIWRDDIGAVVNLFAEDGIMEAANGPLAGKPAVGLEQLHAFYVAGVKRMTPRPFPHHHVIELQGGGRATGRCYVELRSSVDYSWIGAVVYNDEYLKVGDTWKIRRRNARLQNVDDVSVRENLT